MYSVVSVDPTVDSFGSLPNLLFARDQLMVAMGMSEPIEGVVGVSPEYRTKMVTIMKGNDPVYSCSQYLGTDGCVVSVIEHRSPTKYQGCVYIDEVLASVTTDEERLSEMLCKLGVYA